MEFNIVLTHCLLKDDESLLGQGTFVTTKPLSPQNLCQVNLCQDKNSSSSYRQSIIVKTKVFCHDKGVLS